MVLESQIGEFVFFYHKCGCLCCKGLIEKESVDSKGARGRVSKFYWWVAIRSRVWELVSLIV